MYIQNTKYKILALYFSFSSFSGFSNHRRIVSRSLVNHTNTSTLHSKTMPSRDGKRKRRIQNVLFFWNYVTKNVLELYLLKVKTLMKDFNPMRRPWKTRSEYHENVFIVLIVFISLIHEIQVGNLTQSMNLFIWKIEYRPSIKIIKKIQIITMNFHAI